jgi:hypothetical protein
MTTYKNTSGDYEITLAEGLGTLTVNGNFVVSGSQTVVSGNVVTQPFITVAANNIGTITDMGMIAQKTANTFAGFRFDTTANLWQVSSSVLANGYPVTDYANILTNESAAGNDTQIQFNRANVFGASANLTFNYGSNVLGVNGQILLTGSQILANVITPTNIANTVILYSNTTGVGGTGLYFTSNVANDELISKSKSIVYSLIF